MNAFDKQLNNNSNAHSKPVGIGHSFEALGQLNRDDTIIAVSSPPGQSLRGLLRLSGPQSIQILHQLITDIAIQKSDQSIPSHKILQGRLSIYDIPCLIVYLARPNSYTGDETIEIQVPSHPALLETLIQQAISLGARLAEPGEYTFRAFTAGKLDLTQAEGIASIIAAKSDSELRAADMLKKGLLGQFSHEMTDDIATQLALVEAGIDFVDQEDVVPIEPAELDDNLAKLISQLEQLLSKSRSWGSIEAIPRVVLVGKPSVGKSTLFNALLQKQRAVISALPGTTRDILAEPLTLNTTTNQPIEIMLIDIAGLGYDLTHIDVEAQQAANEAIQHADLILHLTDCDENVITTPLFPSHIPILHIQNKVDTAISSKINTKTNEAINISALTGIGISDLKNSIIAAIGDRQNSLAADMLALQPRHENALNQTIDYLKQTRELLRSQYEQHGIDDIEIIASKMRDALDEIAALGGEMTPDDVIGKVFASFCVGK